MMAAPFVAFAASIGLALWGRRGAAIATLLVALALTLGMLAWHWTDSLPISL